MNSISEVSKMEKLIFRKQAADALIIKEVQHGTVKTQNIVDGKPAFTDHKDIKRLGYKTLEEYVEALKAQGYTTSS